MGRRRTLQQAPAGETQREAICLANRALMVPRPANHDPRRHGRTRPRSRPDPACILPRRIRHQRAEHSVIGGAGQIPPRPCASTARHHFALTATLAFTGLRFCHAQRPTMGRLGRRSRHPANHPQTSPPPSRQGNPQKNAPREPSQSNPDLAAILRDHRQQLIATQAPGLSDGWMFPSRVGTLRAPSSLTKAWKRCLKSAGITRRFTPHGLRSCKRRF